jgi:nucleoside-diphosphate-sugar epimerase
MDAVRVLVTGGSGFLGGAVIPELKRRGHEVVALVRSRVAADRVSALGAKPVQGDLDDPIALDAAFLAADAGALANLASLGFGHAAAIVAAAEQSGVERAAFISTTAIFTSLPASSRTVRMAAEATIEQSKLAWTVVRPTMIYGAPGDRNMERLLRFLRRSPVVPLPGGGEHLLQPIHVDDLAWFIVTDLEDEKAGTFFNVAGPDALSLRCLVAQAAGAVGRRPAMLPFPLGPVISVARVYETISRTPRLKVEQLLRLNEDKDFDITAARALGFEPRSFSEGITAEAGLLR